MKKQTAVEWFYQRILAKDIKEVYEQAKEMEKEQLADAFYVKLVEWREIIDEFGCLNLSNHIKYENFQQYYNENYQKSDMPEIEKMTYEQAKDLSIFDELAAMIRPK